MGSEKGERKPTATAGSYGERGTGAAQATPSHNGLPTLRVSSPKKYIGSFLGLGFVEAEYLLFKRRLNVLTHTSHTYGLE